ncbi:MAG: PQQ-like beta-propeller repeat protein [Leptospiraceae bacterium]|nr:PQQ-like beta-propeller repeat protein [Leptospiraceae bacterium]
MKAIRKHPILFALLSLFIVIIAYYIFATVPFLQRKMRPDRGIKFENGSFDYDVPLDPQSPWPRFRANSMQTGRSPVSPNPNQRNPWSFRTGKGIFSSAVVDAKGTVYIGSADHYFYAISIDGKLLWKVRTDEIIDSSALLDDQGVVYVGSGDAHVYAIDRSDGRVIWKSQAHTVEQVQEQFGLKTYNVNWFEGNVGMLSDGSIIAPNDNYLIYSLDRQTGERKQIYIGNELMWALPAVNTKSGRIFTGSQFVAFQNVFAFDSKTGEKLWASGGLGSNASSPLLTSDSAEGALVLGGYDGFVRAYSQDNGKELWSFPTRDHIYASPAQQADGTIIAASADGSVYAINPDDGTLIWQYDTLEPIRSSPAIDGNGIIYVGSGEGKLFAINPDGTLRWAYQCITEVRNDLNGSPGLGFEGIYIAGESGEVFFVPYDYPLSERGKADPRSIQGPGEILPDDGVFLVWTGRFGELIPDPPEQIDANEPLVFRMFVRKDGDTVLSSFDASSFTAKFEPANEEAAAPIVAMAANERFVSLIPQETWMGPEGGTLKLTISGKYLTRHSRIGLKFFGGEEAGAFSRTFTFRVRPRTEGSMPYKFPDARGNNGTILELSRLAAPNPTMLPSWNQIGFDSLHYLAAFVEGDAHHAIAWVIPGKLDSATGQTVPDPNLEDRFVLQADYDAGLLTLYNYQNFILTFIGSWDMPFGKYRLSTRVDPSNGTVLRSPALNALVLGDDLEFYGKFLKIMGLTDFWTGHMWVYGGMNAAIWRPQAAPPVLTGEVQFKLSEGDHPTARIEIRNGSLQRSDHVYGILLVDVTTGQPVHAPYGRGIKVEADDGGTVTAISIPLPDKAEHPMRVYLMVDTFPIRAGTLSL